MGGPESIEACSIVGTVDGESDSILIVLVVVGTDDGESDLINSKDGAMVEMLGVDGSGVAGIVGKIDGSSLSSFFVGTRLGISESTMFSFTVG